MKYLWKHKTVATFLISILFIGILFGVILGCIQDKTFKENIIYSFSDIKTTLLTNKINNIVPHLILIVLMLVSTVFLPLYFITIFYLLYKGVSIGFTIYLFSLSLGIKGFLTGLIYTFGLNLLFLFLFFFLVVKQIRITKNIISYFYQSNVKKRENIQKGYIAVLILSSLLLTNDIVLHLFSSHIIDKVFFWF